MRDPRRLADERVDVGKLRLRTGTYSAPLTTDEIRMISNDLLQTEVISYAGLMDTVSSRKRLSVRRGVVPPRAAAIKRERSRFAMDQARPSNCSIRSVRH